MGTFIRRYQNVLLIAFAAIWIGAAGIWFAYDFLTAGDITPQVDCIVETGTRDC